MLASHRAVPLGTRLVTAVCEFEEHRDIVPSSDVVRAGLEETKEHFNRLGLLIHEVVVSEGGCEILGCTLDCEEGVTGHTSKTNSFRALSQLCRVCFGSSAGALHLFWLWPGGRIVLHVRWLPSSRLTDEHHDHDTNLPRLTARSLGPPAPGCLHRVCNPMRCDEGRQRPSSADWDPSAPRRGTAAPEGVSRTTP